MWFLEEVYFFWVVGKSRINYGFYFVFLGVGVLGDIRGDGNRDD